MSGWAELMFPDASAEQAIKQQWDAIFALKDKYEAFKKNPANKSRLDRARAHYEAGLKDDPNFPQLKEFLAKLK